MQAVTLKTVGYCPVRGIVTESSTVELLGNRTTLPCFHTAVNRDGSKRKPGYGDMFKKA